MGPGGCYRAVCGFLFQSRKFALVAESNGLVRSHELVERLVDVVEPV